MSETSTETTTDTEATDAATTESDATPEVSQDATDWAATFEGMKPEDVKTALDNSRKWEGRAKANVTKAEQLDALLKVLNPAEGDTSDPEKLATDLTAAQRETQATKVENAVLRNAAKHEANPDALTDSRSFMEKVAELDPSADDFTSQVDEAIKVAVGANPNLKLVDDAGKPRAPKPNPTQGNGDQPVPSGDWLRDQLAKP